MKPTTFPESNGVLGGGPAALHGTEDNVADLPVYAGHGQVISCWRLTWGERLRLLFGGRVWLLVLGTNHRPVLLTTEKPFEYPKEQP